MTLAGIIQMMLGTAIGVIFVAAVGSIRYRVAGDAIEVWLLFMVVRRFRLDDIEEVHRRGSFLHESWSGFKVWNAVTLRRRSGLLRNVILTPDDPDRFVEELTRLLAGRAWERPGP
jgi:hypothetical protein